MRDFLFYEVDRLPDGDMSFARLLQLVEQNSVGAKLVQSLNEVEQKELLETFWIFAQLVTMEFDDEN